MSATDTKPILIAGAGIAGLTAALAFAKRGFDVRLFERTERFEEIGAGLQVSPNATRILDRLNVLPLLRPHAVQPEAVVLRRASDLSEIVCVPLGEAAERRWGAPYLVAHRADLQSALLERVSQEPAIQLVTGAVVRDFAVDSDGAALTIETNGKQHVETGRMIVSADGVWSALRALGGEKGHSRFIGQLAWRRTLKADDPEGRAFLDAVPGCTVNAFLHPGFHMIAYPISAGEGINLVAFTQGQEIAEGWSQTPDHAPLRRALRGTCPTLANMAEDGKAWTAWPIHVADLDGPWIDPAGLALIGDAAHAMTPFAAQGAAMAIEDAETLAEAVASAPENFSASLQAWNNTRRRRVLQVGRRGALNHFAWHARGPVATARDAFLELRGPERLAADMDWLYGWKP